MAGPATAVKRIALRHVCTVLSATASKLCPRVRCPENTMSSARVVAANSTNRSPRFGAVNPDGPNNNATPTMLNAAAA